MNNKDVRLAIRISRELRDAALEKARREDLTVSQVVRRFLSEWVGTDLLTEQEGGDQKEK